MGRCVRRHLGVKSARYRQQVEHSPILSFNQKYGDSRTCKYSAIDGMHCPLSVGWGEWFRLSSLYFSALRVFCYFNSKHYDFNNVHICFIIFNTVSISCPIDIFLHRQHFFSEPFKNRDIMSFTFKLLYAYLLRTRISPLM